MSDKFSVYKKDFSVQYGGYTEQEETKSGITIKMLL